MSDPIIADLCRELAKASLTLVDTQTHLAHHAEANAALHCSATVLYSPLHAKVTAAIQQIEHALQRTEAAAAGHDETKALAQVLLDLDRCKHGRHQGDECGSCGGPSKGNHNMPPGRVIGYGLYADPIVVPERADRHEAKAWRQTRAGESRP